MNYRSLTKSVFAIAAVTIALTAHPAISSDYVSEVLADNPLVYLRFEETAGVNAQNGGSSGATHDGTYLGGFTQGQVGAITGNSSNNAVRLDGSSGRVGINSVVPSTLFSDNSYSVEVWFNQDILAQSEDIVAGVNPTGGQHGILLETNPGATLRYLHRSPSGNSGGQDIRPSAQTYAAQGWHHLVAVDDGGVMKLYLDGVLDTGPNVSSAINFPVDFVLGRLQPGNSARSFDGLIDEFAVYDQALSQERVLEHFRAAEIVPAAGTPEPSTFILAVLGLPFVLVRRRRRR